MTVLLATVAVAVTVSPGAGRSGQGSRQYGSGNRTGLEDAVHGCSLFFRFPEPVNGATAKGVTGQRLLPCSVPATREKDNKKQIPGKFGKRTFALRRFLSMLS
jgi:hypothetical protein